MKAAIESSDRQFLERVHELGGGTVQEICADLGVTATAVRQRLVRLQGLKMVARELVRSPSATEQIRKIADALADLPVSSGDAAR